MPIPCRQAGDVEDSRLPAHLEVSGLIRQTQAGGGFAAVVKKGEHDAGTLLIVITCNGENSRIYERMPTIDGPREWQRTMQEDPENKREFVDYLDRRGRQDPDLWILELDIEDGERIIGLTTNSP